MRPIPGLASMVAALVLCLLLASATAARLDDQQLSMGEASGAQPRKNTLLTYYFDAYKPTIELSSRGSGRTDRTGLTVRMSKASVNTFMPVVSPRPSGMTHEVTKTWEALKHLATMFSHTKVINQQNPSGPRMFPRGAVALQAASDADAAKTDMASLIAAAEARDHRSMWAETSPGSVLLLPHGGSTAAVADIMDVSYEQATGLVSLELDLVHQPHTVSEFKPHGKQTLNTDSAHYHFATAPGVITDAQALIKSLKESDFAIEGAHVFVKGAFQCDRLLISSFTSDSLTPQAGDTVNVTITITGTKETCPSDKVNRAARAVIDIPADDLDCKIVSVVGSAPAEYKESSSGPIPCERVTSSNFRQAAVQQGGNGGFVQVAATTDGEAWITFEMTADGQVTLLATVGSIFGLDIKPLILNGEGQPPVVISTVSKLLLLPSKAYRRCGDPVTVVALALNATGGAVAGAKVAFSVQGVGKHSASDQVIRTTDTTGRASFVIYGDKPEALSIVAAATGVDGAPVLSHPSHIFFFEERHHMDHREREYYEHRENGRDADTYATAASLKAVEALMKPVSQSN